MTMVGGGGGSAGGGSAGVVVLVIFIIVVVAAFLAWRGGLGKKHQGGCECNHAAKIMQLCGTKRDRQRAAVKNWLNRSRVSSYRAAHVLCLRGP